MKIKVDDTMCIGAGYCVLEADDVFDQDEDTGLVVLKITEPSKEREEAVKSAARRCPVNAIEIIE